MSNFDYANLMINVFISKLFCSAAYPKPNSLICLLPSYCIEASLQLHRWRIMLRSICCANCKIRLLNYWRISSHTLPNQEIMLLFSKLHWIRIILALCGTWLRIGVLSYLKSVLLFHDSRGESTDWWSWSMYTSMHTTNHRKLWQKKKRSEFNDT